MSDQAPPRLGLPELVGAWLRIWTPPRGAVIPPVPWRRLLALVVALAAGAVAVGVFALPDHDAARRREARVEAARHAAFLASVDRIQRPRHGRGPADPGGSASDSARRSARAALVASARSRIGRDAARERAIRGVACERFPRTVDAVDPVKDLARAAAAYDCTAITARFGSQATGRGILGLPFRLVVHFRDGTFAWCRIVPLGDRDRLSHPLPAACATPPG